MEETRFDVLPAFAIVGEKGIAYEADTACMSVDDPSDSRMEPAHVSGDDFSRRRDNPSVEEAWFAPVVSYMGRTSASVGVGAVEGDVARYMEGRVDYGAGPKRSGTAFPKPIFDMSEIAIESGAYGCYLGVG